MISPKIIRAQGVRPPKISPRAPFSIFCLILLQMGREKKICFFSKSTLWMASLLHPLFKTLNSSLKSKQINNIVVSIAVYLHHLTDDIILWKEFQVKRCSDIGHLKTFRKLYELDEESGFTGSATSMQKFCAWIIWVVMIRRYRA